MKKIILTWILLLSCGAPAAYAAPITPLTMTLSSGSGAPVVITDQLSYTPGGDMSSGAGTLTFMTFAATVGTFSINMAAGVSYPLLGGPGLAVLNLSNFTVSSPTGGVLTVTLTDSNYGSAASRFALASGTAVSASATASGLINNAQAGSTVSVQSWINGANSGGPAVTPVLANSSSGTTFGFTNPPLPFIYNGGPFSMFIQAVIDLKGPLGAGPASVNLASEISLAGVPVPVPEPGSLLLLSAGLFLGAIAVRGGRQRKRDRAT